MGVLFITTMIGRRVRKEGGGARASVAVSARRNSAKVAPGGAIAPTAPTVPTPMQA